MAAYSFILAVDGHELSPLTLDLALPELAIAHGRAMIKAAATSDPQALSVAVSEGPSDDGGGALGCWDWSAAAPEAEWHADS